MSDLMGFLNGKPQCIAIVLCDDIIEDRQTGSRTLVRLFRSIETLTVPAMHPHMAVLVSLTGGTYAWPFALSLRCPSGKEMVRIEDVIRFETSFQVVDLVFHLRNLLFTEPGWHFVDVVVDGTPAASRQFLIELLPKGSGR